MQIVSAETINLCDHREVLGVSCGDYRRAGAFAEFVAVPARIVHRLPETFPFTEAALLEAVAVALHAVSLVPITPGSTALVIGAGTIGLLLQQALRVAGCSSVFVTDSIALALPSVSNSARPKLCRNVSPSRSRNSPNGVGVDLAIEAVGKTETVNTAIDCVRKGGTVVLVGNISPEISLRCRKSSRARFACKDPAPLPANIPGPSN